MTTRNQPVCRANDDGHDLYRWVQDRQEWACCAYDHGPLCRRCRPVDETVAALLDDVQKGRLQMWDRDRDGWQFQGRTNGEEQEVPPLED